MTLPADILYDQTNDKAHPLEKDPYGRYLVSIDIAHHQIHEGKSFKVCRYDADLDTDQALSIELTTGAIKPHMVFDFDSISETEVALLRDVTATVSSTNLMTAINMDLNSATTSTISFHHTPTVTNSGTLVINNSFGTGKKLGANAVSRNEYILKPATSYVYTLTSKAENNKVNVCLYWYEKSED